jgi:hypothetical protein
VVRERGDGDHRATAKPSGQRAHVADIDVNRGTELPCQHLDAFRAAGREGFGHIKRRRLGALPRDKTRARTGRTADTGLNLAKPGEGIVPS